MKRSSIISRAGPEIPLMDSVWGLLASFILMVIMLLLLANAATEEKSKSKDVDSPGNLVFELFWPDHLKSDVDLWVSGPPGPKFGQLVGYSRRSSPLLNYLRDDLGNISDITNRNYENVYSRGIVQGEYCTNVVLYSFKDDTLPIDNVLVVVSIKKTPDDMLKQVLYRKVNLIHNQEEITVFCFNVTAEKELDPASVTDFPVKLYSIREE